MYFLKNISYMVVILCVSRHTSGQNYEADIYDDYSAEGKSDSAENSGFVTPLDFSPLFVGGDYDIRGVAPVPARKYQSLFNVGQGQLSSGEDFFQGQSSNKQFSPETFGFLPQFSQGLVEDPASQPKRYQGNTVQIERTKATTSTSDITRSPVQFDIQTNHDTPYKKINKPEQSAALKVGVNNYPSTKIGGETRSLKEDHLAPYKKYSFQRQGSFPAAYQSLSGNSGEGNIFSQLGRFDAQNLRFKRNSNKKKADLRQAKQAEKESEEETEGDNDDDDGESEYDYRSDYFSRPKDFDYSSAYDAPDFSGYGKKAQKKNYDYGEDEEYGADEYERIKSLSEIQAAELKKHPEHCKQVQKNSMTCTVCSNPKTGGSYESCAYTSEPKNNKYAYVKEQKYDSKDQPEDEEESKEVPKTEKLEKSQQLNTNPPKPTSSKPTEQSYENHSSYKFSSPLVYTTTKPIRSNTNNQKFTKTAKLTKKPSSDYKSYYTAPSSPKAESSQPEKYSAYTHDYDNNDDEDDEEQTQQRNNSNNENVSDEESPIPDFYSNNDEKKDVESVLAEFTKKDRSACKKVQKNHMTCYQCTDKKGLKHEECMFVSESVPKSSHLAYKEVKEFNSKPGQNGEGNVEAESNVVTAKPLAEFILTTTEASSDLYSKLKKSQPLKKYNGFDELKKIKPTTFFNSSPLDKINAQYQISSTASTKLETTSSKVIKKREAVQARRVRVEKVENYDVAPSDLSTLDRIAHPDEFSAESKGAFWDDTVPEFNEKLGLALPRYMLEKTEEEINLDKTIASSAKGL